ncbi:MAG: ABC transporter permease, partial [Burkholderiaceae bacterium]|nr:ABC transporter permease [Burkholderiaceae bacterium]
LGTDEQGRDMLSAILYGLRISLAVGSASTVLALSIGLLLGLAAAHWRGPLDALVMRLADLQLSIPALLIALVLLAISGPGLSKIVAALAAVQWAHFASLVRSTALVESSKDYIAAARCLGLSSGRIMLYHLLPNCLSPLLVYGAVQLAAAVSLEATLSFLGLGLPVTEPSLGLLIANGFRYFLSGQYWMCVFPGLALLLVLASINLLVEHVRDVLNPRAQHQ